MNTCTFTGYLTDNPQLEAGKKRSDVGYCEFKLVTYEYVRNKRGEKKRYPTTMTFQAWDSGAEVIANLGEKGMKMTIQASARNLYPPDARGFNDPSDEEAIIFRVNQFDFGCLDKE
jgi:single-stranded DNA-binding protein